MLGTRGIVRGALVGLLLCCALAGLALAASRSGERDDAFCAPIPGATTDSQTKVLRRDGLPVHLQGGKCEGDDSIKLIALSKSDGDKRKIAAEIVAANRDERKVLLPLTREGRKRVARCAKQRLHVRARTRSGVGGTGGFPLKLDSAACDGGDGALPAQGPGNPGPGGGPPPGGDNGPPQGGGPPPGGGDPPPGGGGEPEPEDPSFQTQDADRCDFIDRAHCMFPFPNDHFTAPDESTDTGRRVDFHPLSMPRNRAGVPINPLDYNQNDGFSPGQMIVTHVPGLDSQAAFDRTGAVPITDLGSYDDPNQPVVVIDAETGERLPIWSEIDSNPIEDPDEDPTNPEADGEPDPEDVNLLIRPAVNFEEGHRYIVALRDMRDDDGNVIEADEAFRYYRDAIPTTDGAVEDRRAHFEEIFGTLGDSGIERRNLFLAWDFTVASERNLSERALSIRDAAFAELGDTDLGDAQVQGQAPEFEVTGVTENPTDGVARVVEGTVTVPCYTNAPGCPPGSSFLFAPGSNVPQGIPGNTMEANFICQVPSSAASGPDPVPAKPSLYGHGLLGSAGEVESGPQDAMVREHGFMYCATDWAGFSTQDIGTVAASLQDLSNFPKLVDRMQQGFVNFMYLGRAMIHPEGFGSDPAFQAGGASAIDTNRLYYDGNSQGGIMGGALAALSPDIHRAVLGVPGMNYSTLLRRSVDFDLYAKGELAGVACDELPDPPPEFEPLDPVFAPLIELCPQAPTPVGLYDNYPDQLERPLIISMIQMVWDRGEANGYAHHMTADPLANTPPHEVLLHPAFGDHQVATLTAEVEARTVGAVTNQNPLDPGRIPGIDPLWSIPRVDFSTPHQGSAIVYWDSGQPAPPTENLPPREGRDPHGHPRADTKARQQKAAFMSPGGAVTEVCGGGPCYADGYTGAP